MTIEQLQAKLKNISADMLPSIKKGMGKATLNVEKQAKDNCNPATSPYYRPIWITGNLAGSISQKVEVKGETVVGTVGASAEYAKKIHEGSYTGGQPRPFLTDSIQMKEKETIEFLSDAIETALKKYCV